ncbi:putative receptor like protein 25 [Cryptomeria japonica]|uniref:putative receptor like protein 25 n=1 Tax=Cryptomeria japonica TaxID=3369 RepID=UPI0027DA4079|nr:putative receptor like protein 25 [Cryptomeria japonica]
MVAKSVWNKVDEHVSMIAIGLGFGIGLGGTISVMELERTHKDGVLNGLGTKGLGTKVLGPLTKESREMRRLQYFLLLDRLQLFLLLDLSSNKFGGRIPPALEDLKGFRSPKVSQLGGTTLYEDIPPIRIKGTEYSLEYVLAANTILDLSNNNLTGEIPPNIGNLSQLRLLNLSRNKFEGTIPASLGQIEPLEQLDLSQNRLSGEIPEELCQLSKLSYWNVSFNHLCGPIPAGKQLMTFDERSYQGNRTCFYGYPLQSCK